MKVKSLSRVQLFTTSRIAAHQAPSPMGFSRQEYWSGVPLPFPPLALTVYLFILLIMLSSHETLSSTWARLLSDLFMSHPQGSEQTVAAASGMFMFPQIHMLCL